VVCLIISAVFIGVSYSEVTYSFYTDINRSIYTSPQSAAMAKSALCYDRNAAPTANPALLPLDSANELAMWYADIFVHTFSTSTISYITPIRRNGAIGASFNYIFVPDIEYSKKTGQNDFSADQFKIVSVSEVIFRIASGWKHRFGVSDIVLSYGGAVNVLRRNLAGATGYGIGFDVGGQVSHELSGVSLAFLSENITGHYVRWSSVYQELGLPHARLGLGWQRELPYIYGRIQLAYTSPDLLVNEGVNSDSLSTSDIRYDAVKKPYFRKAYEKPMLLLEKGRYGISYTIMDRFTIRAGLYSGQPHFGAGLNAFNRQAGLDMAYLAHDLGGTYQIGMNFRW